MPQRAGKRLEASLGNMVRVGPGPLRHMQSNQGVGGESAEKLLEQLGIHLADPGLGEGHGPGEKRTAGNVDGSLGQSLVHRHHSMAETSNAALVAKRLGHGAAEDNADILGGVVEIDVEVTLGANRQIEQRMTGERRQHVVEKTDASVDVGTAGAIEIEGQSDVGLRGGAGDGGAAGHDAG